MVNYCKLEKVLPLIPKSLRRESDEAEMLRLALDGYRHLSVPMQLQNQLQVFEIVDHKVQLPSEIKVINFVTWMKSNPSLEDLDTLADSYCNDCDTVQTTTTTITDPDGTITTTTTSTANEYLLAHKIVLNASFYNTNYFNNNFIPLKYIQGSVKNNNLCDNCINRFTHGCNETFSVDHNKIMWTSFKDGFVCVDYDSEILEDGSYLIIEDNDVLNYLKHYIMQGLLEDRAFSHEQGTYQMAKNLQTEVDIWFRKASGALILKGIDRNLIESFSLRGFNENILKFLPNNYRAKFERTRRV